MKLFACLLLTLFLTACSQLPKPTKQSQTLPPAWLSYQNYADTLTDWTIKGRIAIKMPDTNASASLYWLQANHTYTIDIVGPFGQGAINLSGDQNLITLTDDKGNRHSAFSGEALMYQTLGWQVPIEQIHWWVRGIPSPSSSFTASFNSSETNPRLSSLEQNGWRVSYTSHHSEPPSLPKRIVLEREDIKITLILRQWIGLEPRSDIDFGG